LKIIRHFNRTARYALVSGLIVTALALSFIRFWLLPKAALFRDELQSRIGAMIDETVLVHGLSARMHGFDPEVVLKGFEIMDEAKEREPLRFAQVRIRFSLIRSLLAARPVVYGIRVVGAPITLQRNRDGTVGVLGLKRTEHLPPWLFAEGTVELRDIELEWRDLRTGAKPVALGRSEIRLRNEAGRHLLNADFALSDESDDTLRFAADFAGAQLDRASWRGRFYLEGNGIGANLLGDPLPAPVKLRSGAASFRLWGDWRDRAVQQILGRIDLTGASLSVEDNAGNHRQLELELDRVGGSVRWHRAARGWRLDVRQFGLSLSRQAWPQTRFGIAVDDDADGPMKTIRAAASYLRFEDARVLLDAFPALDEKVRDALRGLAPRGEGRDLRMVYAPGAGAGEGWALCGGLSDLGLDAWRSMPGVRHFSGQICGNDRQGRLGLHTKEAELILDQLLSKPIRIERAEGVLDWHQADGEWHIAASGLELAAPGLEAQARFEYRLPEAEGGSPFLAFRAHLARLEARSLRDYLPVKAMREASATWLQGAFTAGRVKGADVLFQGNVADFPFTRGEGVFEVLANAEDFEVHYDADWPPLFGVNGRIRFHGPAMFIDATGGRVGDVPFRTCHAEAVDLLRDHWLTVNGQIDTSVPESLDLLKQTPLRHIPERLLKVVDPRGEASVALNLKIPLVSGVGQVGVNGTARLDRAALTVTDLNLDVQNIAGTLHFTHDGVEARDVKAVALGEAVAVEVGRDGDDILVAAAGRASVPALQRYFPTRFWSHAQGALDYRLSLRIPESMNATGVPLRTVLISDLVGLGIRLPAPLGKTAHARKDLRVEMAVQSGSNTPMRVFYGDGIQARLALAHPASGFRVESADLAAGRSLPSPSLAPGIGIHARLHELDLKAWKELLTAGEAGELRGPVLRALELDVAEVSWEGNNFGRLSVAGRLHRGVWSGTLDSPWGKGRFSASRREFGRPILEFDLDYLKLPKFSRINSDRDASPLPDPSTIPDLKISSKQLLWQEKDLGGLMVETERWTQGMNIRKLTVQQANHQLNLRGSWMRVDGNDETRAEGRATIADLGKFVTQLGYAGEIRDTPAAADISLAWQGAPHQVSGANVEGDVKMKLGRGAILKMEPGMGRALGMLNLYTLRRLLLLDFSDLFGKGLAYDSMEGHFRLGSGQAQTRGFVMDAVAAKILVTGRVGLVAQDLDEIVAVIPHTLASLPIAGALVGGAAFDAAISMAGRLFGKESASIASTNYSVKGSWDDPQIERIGGYMPLEMLERAWSGVKDFSGFGVQDEKNE
jgi:uncharacterized protein (TIGR02099 family)